MLSIILQITRFARFSTFMCLDYLPCTQKSSRYFRDIHFFISEPIFKMSAALFTTFEMQKEDLVINFYSYFRKKDSNLSIALLTTKHFDKFF